MNGLTLEIFWSHADFGSKPCLFFWTVLFVIFASEIIILTYGNQRGESEPWWRLGAPAPCGAPVAVPQRTPGATQSFSGGRGWSHWCLRHNLRQRVVNSSSPTWLCLKNGFTPKWVKFEWGKHWYILILCWNNWGENTSFKQIRMILVETRVGCDLSCGVLLAVLMMIPAVLRWAVFNHCVARGARLAQWYAEALGTGLFQI